jgi:uncharacterized protein YjgD (DUF1641 family)
MGEIDDDAAKILPTLLEKLAVEGDAVVSAIDKLVIIERNSALDHLVVWYKMLTQAFKDTGSSEPVSIAGSLKVLRDPDIQKALGFLLNLAKKLERGP